MIHLVVKSGNFIDSDKKYFTVCARKAVYLLNQNEDNLTIVLSDDDELQSLNRQFSGKDYPTDVLSFTANQLDPESGMNYLGDIIISTERAISQARSQNITTRDEITTLIIHGILHLCGYDHEDSKSHKEMFSKQEEVLQAIRGQVS